MDSGRALRVLLELTRSLTEEHSLEDALQYVVDAALDLVPAGHGSLRLLDESGTELLACARAGEGSDQVPVPFQSSWGVAGWVLEHGELARIDDARTDPRFRPVDGQGFEIRSLLTVPLWSAGNPIGVLSLSSAKPGLFAREHEDLARLLANCAVPAIERARLERLAVTDSHTRAFNQGYLLPRLRAEIERAGRYDAPLSILLMDLDHFKDINDTFGHAVGDQVLRAFADLVRDTVRRYDVFVRRGGEEFVLIMPAADEEEAAVVAERIRRSTEESRVATEDGGQVHYTVSIGLASWDGHEPSESLERRADRALYEAKRNGRNRVCRWASSMATRPPPRT